jgi:hypothetical protein
MVSIHAETSSELPRLLKVWLTCTLIVYCTDIIKLSWNYWIKK